MSATHIDAPAGSVAHQDTYREIAVALTGAAGDVCAVDAALDLARASGGQVRLLQLLMMPTPFVDAWSLVPDAGFSQAYDEIREAGRRAAERWREYLAAQQVPGEVQSLETQYVEPAHLATLAARCSDLIVLAMPYREPIDTATVHTYFASLLFDAGVPVLVVPSNAPASLPPHRAVVAWADTPEATRAAHDALGLLRGCTSVDVLAIRTDSAAPADDAGVEAFTRHLVRHGVAAHAVSRQADDAAVADLIMQRACDADAQLIVAGGYGHGRMREWAFGGVTRELFLSSPVPVFFSH